jgi:hypothetical protein
MTRALPANYRRKKVDSLRDRLIREPLALRPLDGQLRPVAVVQLAPVPTEVKLIDVSGQMLPALRIVNPREAAL